jgi:hypothetical protein
VGGGTVEPPPPPPPQALRRTVAAKAQLARRGKVAERPEKAESEIMRPIIVAVALWKHH